MKTKIIRLRAHLILDLASRELAQASRSYRLVVDNRAFNHARQATIEAVIAARDAGKIVSAPKPEGGLSSDLLCAGWWDGFIVPAARGGTTDEGLQELREAVTKADEHYRAQYVATEAERTEELAALEAPLAQANGRATQRILSAEKTMAALVSAERNGDKLLSRSGGEVTSKSYKYKYATTHASFARRGPGRWALVSCGRSENWPS